MIDCVDDLDGLIAVTLPRRATLLEQQGMNRFFTKKQVVSEYRLPARLQDELFCAVQPVEQDGQGEPLYLEAQLDRWLAGRFGADQGAASRTTASSQEAFLTIREVATLLRCSYCEARERMLDGRIRAIRDGRWLRTRRQWVEEYIAEKTIKAASSEPGVFTVPDSPRRRQGYIKLKKGGIGEQFLRERAEAAKKQKTP
jgi:excisionase family DNA binding protein